MEISEIKQQLTLATVLKHYNLKPDKNLRLNCPFHEDKTPSLQVYYKTHTAYCFSSNCKTHGKSLDVIDFILHKENCTKAEAIKKAIEILGGENTTTFINPINEVNPPMKPSISKEQFLQNMFTYFKNAVHNSKPAQEYIKQRGLDATKIEVGYNTAQFHHGARRDETLINNCVNIGLLSPWGTSKTGEQAYKPFAKYCICFALRDRGNHITGLYFRSTETSTGSASDAKHFYLKESTGIYPKYPSADTEKLIIAESVIDTASLLQIESITKHYSLLSAYGTNRLNDEMKTAIIELKQLKEIIFAFDNDQAGGTATAKYAKELKALLPNVVFSKIELPCKDINETLVAHQPEIIEHLLATRTNIFLSSEKNKIIEKPINATIVEANKLNTSNPYKLIFTTDTAMYLIKGGVDKVMSKLTVTLEIINEKLNESINTSTSSVHSKRRFKIDLYDNKQIEKTVQEASELLQLTKWNLEKDIHELTEQLDHYREKEMQTNTEETDQPQQYILTTVEKTEALQLANDTKIIEVIKNKLAQTGIVGEEENKTFLYIIAASHIQENPLNALIQGSSGSGKTNLLKGIFKTIPEESKKIYSRCSEKMLYNVPKYYFKNKLICFEDVDGLGEEAEYAWRELVSNGELISGVSYKDEKGNIGIKELTVYGPITSIACTTKGAIYADNMSRLFLIAIDESKEQTQKINEYQAKEASGQINKAEQIKAIQQLQNFSRILEPYKVYNPFATKLKLPEGIQDERRLYKLYLHFIEIITVLHQYQRKKTNDQKLITKKQDCQIAKDLMFECIMLKMDELDGSLRQFFERLKDYIGKQNNTGYEFTQREIREVLQVKKTQLSYYINELMSLEYLQQTSTHINKGNRYKVLHFDNYRKTREEVKSFLQKQIDNLPNE
jgi:DNA primase